MIKQRRLLGADSIFPFYSRTLSSILESAHCLLHTLLLPSVLWGFHSIPTLVHSPIQYLKHDWVEGSNSRLEFLRMLSTQLWSNAWASFWRHYRYECCVPQCQHDTRKWGRACTNWGKVVAKVSRFLELCDWCSVAFVTSHLKATVMEVVGLGLFGVWCEAQVFWQEKKSWDWCWWFGVKRMECDSFGMGFSYPYSYRQHGQPPFF